MKWKTFISLLLLLLLLLLSGCGIIRRKTIIKTQTIVQLDTIIIVKHDTVPIIKMGTIHDTIKIENTASRVIAYFDIGLQKFVVRLEGKPFYVPFKINQRVITMTKIVDIKKKSHWWIWYLLGIGTILGLTLIYKKWW